MSGKPSPNCHKGAQNAKTFKYNIIYVDWKISWQKQPFKNDLKLIIDQGYNIIMLAFMLGGHLTQDHKDALSVWITVLNDQDRQEILNYAHSKNAKILLSLGGGTDHLDGPGGVIAEKKGADYAELACDLVLKWGLDGLDFDLELSPANNRPFLSGEMQEFLSSSLEKAREILPKSQGYLISHAPMGPYVSDWADRARGYTSWMLKNQDNIDFLSIQYYNQHDYTTYETIFLKSHKYPGSSVKELIEAGISSEKIVVGKPLTLKDANNGYIEVEQLAEWGCRANKEIGFIGGYMTWMFHNDNREASEVWARKLNRNCEC